MQKKLIAKSFPLLIMFAPLKRKRRQILPGVFQHPRVSQIELGTREDYLLKDYILD